MRLIHECSLYTSLYGTLFRTALPATVPSSVPATSVFTTTPPATAPSSVPPAAVPSSVSFSATAAALSPVFPQATVTGHVSQISGAVVDWPFPDDFSQSTVGGRNGSNVCAFISVYFGQVASKGILPPRQGLELDCDLEGCPQGGNDLRK